MYSRSTHNREYRVPEHYSGTLFRDVTGENERKNIERDAVGRLSALPPRTSEERGKNEHSVRIKKAPQARERRISEEVREHELNDNVEKNTSEDYKRMEKEVEISDAKPAQGSLSALLPFSDIFGKEKTDIGDEFIIAALLLILLGDKEREGDNSTFLLLLLLLIL